MEILNQCIIKRANKLELQTLALSLPNEEQLEFADWLVESNLPPLTDEQKELLERRWEAYKANPDDVFSWEEVRLLT